MQPLKLTALDQEDLAIISAHLQDAVARVGDIEYLPKQKKLLLLVNRFDWESAEGPKGVYLRRRACVQLNRVFAVKRSGLRQDAPDTVLSLLAIVFEPGAEPPGGVLDLTFSGGAALRAEVECIEVALDDLGPAWETPRKPSHAGAMAED